MQINYKNINLNELLEMFKFFNGKIILTTDLWSSISHSEPYICVTTHLMDHNWFIQKRIIVFK